MVTHVHRAGAPGSTLEMDDVEDVDLFRAVKLGYIHLQPLCIVTASIQLLREGGRATGRAEWQHPHY